MMQSGNLLMKAASSLSGRLLMSKRLICLSSTNQEKKSVLKELNLKDASAAFEIGGQMENRKGVVSVSEWNDETRIDIRWFVKIEDGKRWIPTKQGVSLPRGAWEDLKKLIPDIDEAVAQKAED